MKEGLFVGLIICLFPMVALYLRGNSYESVLSWEKSCDFAKDNGVERNECARIGVFNMTRDCSGMLSGKPVRFECDDEHCSWVVKP